MSATEDIARFIIETSPEQIPDAILHEGKRCFINYLAVSLYASKDPSLNILLDVFREEGGKRHASVVGAGVRTSLQNAALANGYLGHLDDYDDTHFPTIIHPSSPTLPAALAVAERGGSSGRDVLVASILGMEICCRIGMAIHPAHYDAGWHITGTCGVFGAVAPAGRLMGIDISQMVYALGIAGTQASGVREVFGSMTKPFHPGRAAQSGVLAALLAQRGFTSTTAILEGRRGFAAVLSSSHDLSKATDDLGEQWELHNNGLKPYACGVVNHPLIDAMVSMRDKDGVTPEAVESVSAQVHPLVLELGCVDIWCIMDTCQRLNYAMNNGRKSLNFCAHAQTSTLERRTIAGATSRPSCGWHEVVLLGDCCLSTTVTGTAYISASHAGVKRVYGNECISILCKTPIWSMSSLIAL